jgi:hypothetical protein
VVPRPFRWILAFPYSPWWLGAAAGAGYLLLSGSAALGGSHWLGGGGTMELSYALWFAWVPVSVVLLVRGTERDAGELAPTLGVDPSGRETLRHEALSVSPRAIWIGAAIGLSMTGAGVALGFSANPALTGAVAGFVIVREIAVELSVFCVMGWGVGAALRLSQLTAERARPDLLARNVFAPLVRNGSRLALLWLVLNAIGLPTFLAPPASVGAETAQAWLAMTAVLALFAVGALLIPTQGARQAIRAAKAEELAKVHAEIAGARRARDDERLPGLLAWENRIEGLAEWPINAAALRRIGLYLFIPLASWVGGALVERLVDTALS